MVIGRYSDGARRLGVNPLGCAFSAGGTVQPRTHTPRQNVARDFFGALTFHATRPTRVRTALKHATRSEPRQRTKGLTMSAIGGGGNYISDGQIMSWLATEQNRIYSDLNESMDLSDKRAEFTDKLNNIKADLETANKSHDHDFSKVDGELQDLMGKYGSDPEFQGLCDGLKDMASQIHSGCQAQHDYADQQAQHSTDKANYEAAFIRVVTQTASAADKALVEKGYPQAPTEPPPQVYDDGQMQSWDTLISGKTDVTGKNDQLTMIHIQELKATLDQSSQLGSTFISSGDKTSSAIINNIA
jgi:hypothetical protein